MEYFWIVVLLPAFFAGTHGNCGAPPRLDFGELNSQFINQDNFSINANVTYKCRDGFTPVSGIINFITCLSDSTWSTPTTFCTRKSCGNPGEILNGELSITDTLFGSRVNYTCNLGYNMISRRNYRDCQADGTWSNELPECEVQLCSPPIAIPDGTFSPDKEEYEYLNAVTYECSDKTLSLIGEKSLVCTADGDWSSDPPRCTAVKCDSPTVPNAIKVSGFTGPYVLNSAVRFECNSGFTMEGASSVTCSASNTWDPPLPVCKSSTVTQSPATTKKKEPEPGGTTVTQKPSATKEKDESNGEGGGSSTGAIVVVFI